MIVELTHQFVDGVGDDINDMITDQRLVADGYAGLNSDRDTEQEVEKALQFFPETLNRRGGRFDEIPCECLLSMYGNNSTTVLRNAKAVSFVPLFVRLAIEYNLFDEEERGGLLTADDDGEIRLLCLFRYEKAYKTHGDDHRRNADAAYLAVLTRLRQSGLFKMEDIQHYQLVRFLCCQIYFSEEKFQFLTEWCPESLLQLNSNGELPLHFSTTTVQKFRVVLDAMFHYYPRWRGLHALFRIDDDGYTPCQLACHHNLKNERTTVIEIMEETLIRYSTTTPINMHKALVVAVTDERIHVDCLYFLMRRNPNVILGILHRRSGTMMSSINNQNDGNGRSSSSTNNRDDSTAAIGHRNNDNNKNYGNDDADTVAVANDVAVAVAAASSIDNNNNAMIVRRSTRKRKRTKN